jgi:hypothetical protein
MNRAWVTAMLSATVLVAALTCGGSKILLQAGLAKP